MKNRAFNIAAIAIMSIMMNSWTARAADAVWQWSTPVNATREGYGPAVGYLWVPPDCKQIRGILIAQNNMEEPSIIENPIMRKALAEQGFAEVYASPAFNLFFDFTHGAGEQLDDMLTKLADVSGYGELKHAPMIALGHSAAASWPYYLAAWAPERVLACISTSGQWPYARGMGMPDIWGVRHIDFIPSIETMGEFEAAESWANNGLHDRKNHPLIPLSMLACPAEGHFAASDAKVKFLAMYIKKAIQYRLPEDTPMGQAPQLKPVDPSKTGWLADRWRGINGTPAASPAPVADYKGDPDQAFWYFDEETAKAAVAYGEHDHGKKTQLVGITQDGQMCPQTTQHVQVFPKWEPAADGITFKLTGAFYDTVPPPANARPAGWAGAAPGTAIGHASGGGPVYIEKIVGPFEKVGPDTFRLRLEKGIGTGIKQYELVMAAKHPGDEQYKAAVQQAQVNVPLRNTKGADQTLTFPAIADQPVGGGMIELKAISSANVPVSYYIKQGPAELHGNQLTMTAIPPRAKFPIRVTVVAWQYGHTAEPALKTAEPVEQTFVIVQNAPK